VILPIIHSVYFCDAYKSTLELQFYHLLHEVHVDRSRFKLIDLRLGPLELILAICYQTGRVVSVRRCHAVVDDETEP
jgi:hypothetical protein